MYFTVYLNKDDDDDDPLSLFLLLALHASYGKLRFPESSTFGRRTFEQIGFQVVMYYYLSLKLLLIMINATSLLIMTSR